jgi:hypothetical protein
MDINQIIDIAKKLGIKLPAAELGTEPRQCWEDRVLLAHMFMDREDFEGCIAAPVFASQAVEGHKAEHQNRYATKEDGGAMSPRLSL